MLDAQDSAKLRRLLDEVRRYGAQDSVAEFFTGFTGGRDPGLDGVLVFDHAALLVFPEQVADVTDLLTSAGFAASEPVASVVVRRRLAVRYDVAEETLPVAIVRGTIPSGPAAGRGVEVFAATGDLPPALVDGERANDTEAHFAFTLVNAGDDALESVRKTFANRFALVPDGGGYNPFDGAESGGRSVLYFRTPDGSVGRSTRFELTGAGHFPEVVAAHLRSAEARFGQAPEKLLSILAGHWAARAVHVAAELGLADLLAEPATAADVAGRAGTHPDATARLLRYLAHVGVVRAAGDDRYALTPTGELLRADNPFRDLTRLYGGTFYEAWGDLLPAVRDGGSAFGHRFGVEHFDYFAAHPDTARTFDRTMAAVTDLVAGEIGAAYEFPAGSTVVDVGGGNGALLRAVLRGNPTVRGVLFDRNHVTTAVDDEDRFRAEAGDFFTEVPDGGDVYLLSRVLHDWDDVDCLRILTACRAACGDDAALLVLERLLPADVGGFSLALPWDMQMLAVTGGRERSRAEYDKLLAAAGFRLTGVRPLPVDMNLLVAVPS
ncbi:MAG TPA: methyltransferase [Actinocatenispora sp.]